MLFRSPRFNPHSSGCASGQNDFHRHYGQSVEDVAAANAAIAAAKGFWAALAGSMSGNCNWTHLGTVDQIDPNNGQLTGQLAGTQQTGAGSGGTTLLPQEVQGLFRWNTGFFVAGRQLTGHTYVPAVVQGACAATGQPATTFNTAATNAITALLVTPSTTKFVIWHRPKAPATTGGVVGVAVQGALQQKFAVLKSRRD
jgi:hypothetical protein